MKKNRMMRAASALLIAVLLTTSAISGTFAKYVTTASGTDTARVAKWGVVVTANGETFAKTYAKDDNSFTLAANTVVSSDKVVAPGTEGTMASMTLTGTPEVAARVTYTADFVLSDNWVVDGDFYCPLVITVAGTAIDGADYTAKADFEDAVETAIAGYSKDYAAGTDLSSVGTESLAITWEWPFEGDDVKDTKLGDKAVAEDVEVSLTVNTTVTQID